MDTPIVEPKERDVLPLSNISKEALKAKRVIDQWEQKMMN